MTLNGQIPCHVSEWKIKRGIIVPDLHVEHYSTQQIKATKMKWDGRNKWCNYFPISNQQRRLHFAQTCQIKHRAPFSIVHRFSCQETSSSNLATKSIMNNHGHKLTPLAFPSESKKDHDISNQTEPNRTKPKAKRTNEMERYESQCVEWLIDRSWVSTTQLFQRPLGARCGASVRGPAVSKAARNLQPAPVNRSALFTCKRPTRPVQCTRSQCNCTRSSRRFLPAEGFFFVFFWVSFFFFFFFFLVILLLLFNGATRWTPIKVQPVNIWLIGALRSRGSRCSHLATVTERRCEWPTFAPLFKHQTAREKSISAASDASATGRQTPEKFDHVLMVGIRNADTWAGNPSFLFLYFSFSRWVFLFPFFLII